MSGHTPRPLRLATNSASSTPTNDVFSSPSPPPGSKPRKRYSMMAATTYSSSSPTTSTSNDIAQAKAARRKSSIGYFPPDSTYNSRRGSLIRRKSLGALNESLKKAGGHVESWTKPGDRASTLSMPAFSAPGAESAPETPARERPPLTLMEKHADLLRFIAQKESKCLELRSQLALHEAELAELKRKWQRIFNRGFERDHHPTSGHGSVDAGSVVFGGIKEGVQEMSRLFAAGFSPQAVPSSPSSSNHAPKIKPRPPSLINKSHSAKESESSISTCVTSRSGNTNGRFSQSSMSSFGEEPSASWEEEGSRTFGKDSHGNDDPHAQVLMVRDTGATPTMSPNPEYHQQRQKQLQRQSLSDNHLSASSSSPQTNTSVIGDFEGQIWTSEVQSTTTRAHRRKSREVARLDFEHLDFSSISPSVLLSPPMQSSSNTTSPGASPRLGGSLSPSFIESSNGKASGTGINGRNGLKLSSSPSLGGLAPMSSIPGFGLTAGVAGVSSPPVSSWMDSMGKKFGQLQRSSTFTKNQKRASLLLSDVSNSIVNVLAPSTPNSTIQSASATTTAGTNGMKPSASKLELVVPPASPHPSSSGSLLDDEDEDETAKLGSANVLQPIASLSATSASAVKNVEQNAKKKPKEDSDDEEWNW
ncbi:hypothetical protein D9756_008211 [Leucocoprinus leucothites]|uniref:Uncharacterized protein n=1 Tax=Leucocoprinus leucothites TaxID=201217 RepID=A0A8H5CZV7_9AGAR|nr:hypothetical protein D9756_008211 [Leucoagaricus leucothites]